MSDNYQSDPYVGKIVKCVRNDSYLMDNDDDKMTYYKENSLFLVVGIKQHTRLMSTKQYYILKPLQNDLKKLNIDKQLVWCHHVFYVGIIDLPDFQIVD